MRSGWSGRTCLALMVVVASAAPAFPQAATTEFSDEWEFVVAPYLWATHIDADATLGPLTIPLVVPFSALLDNLDFAFAAHVIGKKGAWGFDFDITYVDLGIDLTGKLPPPFEGASPNMDFKMTLAEGLGSYRLGGQEKWFELLAGVRYRKMKNTLELTLAETERSVFDESWVDAMVGIRTKTDLGSKFVVSGRADLSAGGTDFTYNLQGGLAFNASKKISILLEYRFLNVDYKNDQEGAQFFAFDGSMKGPLLGVGIPF